MDRAGMERDSMTAVALAILILIIVGIGAAVLRASHRRKERRTRLTRAAAELGTSSPYCFCGLPAERPASRTGEPTWLDDIFPMWRKVNLKAQYKPAIPFDGVPTLCALHGRTWDARLEHKVVEVVALAQAELHRTIAERMAAYEGGELAAELEATLTNLQKKQRDKLKANKSAPPTGQTTVVVVDPAAYNPRGVPPEPVLDGPPAVVAVTAPATSPTPVPKEQV